jgi:hypothetical protein
MGRFAAAVMARPALAVVARFEAGAAADQAMEASQEQSLNP